MNGLSVPFGALARYGEEPMTTRVGETTTASNQWPGAQAKSASDSLLPDAIARYQRALSRLRPQERHAIVARVERQQSYSEVATALGAGSAETARRIVIHALAHLVWEMDDAG